MEIRYCNGNPKYRPRARYDIQAAKLLHAGSKLRLRARRIKQIPENQHFVHRLAAKKDSPPQRNKNGDGRKNHRRPILLIRIKPASADFHQITSEA
jgi:hypothetical protein